MQDIAERSNFQERDRVTPFLSLYDKVFPLLVKYLKECDDPDTKVLEYRTPVELQKEIEFALGDSPVSEEELLELINKTLTFSVRTRSRKFVNQLFAGVDNIGIISEFIAIILNTSTYTYNAAPVFSLMEKKIVSRMGALIGWEKCEGTFCPGGSISNLTSMILARYRYDPNTREKGLLSCKGQLVAFTSDQSHYSIDRAGMIIGIGRENCIKIPSNKRGQMQIDLLEKAIQEQKEKGNIPFYVNATLATTVLGAIDDIEGIHSICEKYGIWMHVDASWGGALLLSRKHRHLTKGIHLADSVTWNPHKGMAIPLQGSVLLCRDTEIMRKSNSSKAVYLFVTDENYSHGDKTINCGRKNDALKVYLSWQYYGLSGYEKMVDGFFEVKQYFLDEIRKRENLQLLFEDPMYTNIPFWFTPKEINQIDDPDKKNQVISMMHKQTTKLLKERGLLMVNCQKNKNDPHFFRMIINNPYFTKEDAKRALDDIEECGRFWVENNSNLLNNDPLN
jgi:glutamate/tyrosine decarboxylase-like PLP-dependent enzyme